MENYTLQNNIKTITKREILGFLIITALIGLMSSLLSFHGQLLIIISIIYLYVLLFVFLKAKVYTVLRTLSGIILLIFLVPGSINLSVVTDLMGLTGLRDMKTTVGINLNGIRLLLFCLVSGIYLIKKGTISKPFKIYCIFLLYCFFTLSYTLDIVEGVRLFAKLLVPLLIYSVAKSVSYLNFKKINKAFIGVIFLHLPFVFFTLVAWFKYTGGGGISRTGGLSGAMVIFGTFMVFMFILFYYRNLILQKETGKKGYLPILISLLGVILSGTRAAWIGLLVAMFMLGVFKKVKNIIIIAILAMLLIVFFGSQLQQRMGIQTVGGKLVLGQVGGGGTLRHRLLIWEWLSQEKIPQRIFWGYGLGSTKNILSELPKAGIPMLDYPGNEYIRLLLEGGIIGIFLFCCSVFYMALFFIRKYKNILFILPIVVYLIFCLTGNTLNNYFTSGALFAYILVYFEKCFARNRAIDGEKSNILLSEEKEEA